MAISEQIGLNFVTKSEKKVLNQNLILYQCLAGELALYYISKLSFLV